MNALNNIQVTEDNSGINMSKENGMSLRSNVTKALTSNQHDKRGKMATKENFNEEQVFKTPARTKGEKTKTDKTKSEKAIRDKEADQTNTRVKGVKEKEHCNNSNPLNQKLFDMEIAKGYVADRIESLNNTPATSPATSPVQPAGIPQRKKMLSARNGQLVLEEDNMQALLSVQRGLDDHEEGDLQKSPYSPCTRPEKYAASNESSLRYDSTNEDEEDETSTANDLQGILHELTSTVKKLEKSVRGMDKKNKEQQKQFGTLEAIQAQDAVKLRGMIESINHQEDKINALIGIVMKQQHQIQALNSKWDAAYAKENKNNIIINGIPESQGKDCFHEAANFIKNILKVEKPVAIAQAYRAGTGTRRPILAKLKTVNDKPELYKKTGRLKQLNKGRDRPYYITDQLPEAWAEQRRAVSFLKLQNAKLPLAQQRKVDVTKGVLSFDGNPYNPPVKAPTFQEICQLTNEKKAKLRDLNLRERLNHGTIATLLALLLMPILHKACNRCILR